MNTRYARGLAPLLFSVMNLVVHGGMARQLRVSPAPLSGPPLLQVVGWYLLTLMVYGATLIWVERRGGIQVKWLWGTAILLRLLFLFTTPALSTDVYRYLWDGYLANHGVSPYAYPIEAAELDYLDVPQRQLANHTWMASPYLPAAQVLFRSLAVLSPLRTGMMQVGMVVFDLLAALLLARLLRLAGLPGHRLIIYLWHPLVIIETAHSAHVDAWMIWLTVAAIYLTLNPSFRGSQLLAPCLLAMATLTKIVPLLLMPVLFWRWSWRQRILFGLVTAGLLLPAGWRAGWGLTGPMDGTGLFGALRIYNAQWNFNSGLFHWLERWLGAPGYGSPMLLAKVIVFALLLLFLLVIFVISSRPRPAITTLRLLALPFMAFLLLTPTVHPWYALILIAFLPFLPPGQKESRVRWLHTLPWLYLSGALALSYLSYINPLQPGELEWVRLVEWLPPLVLLMSLALVCAWSSLATRSATLPFDTAASSGGHSQPER